MAKASFFAKASLKGIDDLSVPWGKALRRAENRAGRSFSKIEKAGFRAARAWKTLEVGAGIKSLRKGVGSAARGFKTMALASGAAVGAAALAVDQFGKWELTVARLGNVVGAGIDPVKEFGAQIQRIALETGTDPILAAQAAYMAFSGGVEQTKEGLQAFLPVALRAAKAGFAEPAVAVDAMTSALNTFKDTGITAAEVADKLFVTEALGKTDFGKIASEIGNIAGFAKEMGLSLDETLAPMAALTKTGLSTGSAFTQLSALIAGVVKPTEKAKKQFKRLNKEFGLEFGADAITKMGGIKNVLLKIQAAAKGPKGKDVITAMFGRKEAIKGVLALTGSQLEDLDKTLSALQNSAGTADRNFANVQQRTGFRIAQMKTGFKTLITELGGGIAEGLGLDKVANIPDAVQGAGKKMRSAAKNFAGAFLTALSPGTDLADLNFDDMARNAGKSFGTFLTVATKLASAMLGVLDTAVALGAAIAALAFDPDADPLSAKAKEKGVTLGRVRGAGAVAGGPAGFAAAARVERSQRELREKGIIGKDLTPQEVFARQQARNRDRDARAKTASAERARSLAGPVEAAAIAARLAGGAGGGGVVAETKVALDVNVKLPEGASADVKATSKSKGKPVPVTANVGKRKVGT